MKSIVLNLTSPAATVYGAYYLLDSRLGSLLVTAVLSILLGVYTRHFQNVHCSIIHCKTWS